MEMSTGSRGSRPWLLPVAPFGAKEPQSPSPHSGLRAAAFKSVEPGAGAGVAGHAPVAAGGEGDGADLGAIGGGAALVLIGEESCEEDAQPLAKLGGRVGLCESAVLGSGGGFGGEEEDARRVGSPAEEVIEEEIDQFVRADRRLGRLHDLARGVGRQE